MPPKRIKIIPAIHGKLTQDGKVSGQWTTEDGLKTEVITVSIVAGDDVSGCDSEQDADLTNNGRPKIDTGVLPQSELESPGLWVSIDPQRRILYAPEA